MIDHPAIRAALLSGVTPIAPVCVGVEWSELLRTASRERVVGLLARAVDQGEVQLSSAATEELVTLSRQMLQFAVTADAVVAEIAAMFAAHDIDWRLLKGMATAQLLYADAGDRQTGDVDLLVRPADFERALRVIEAAGANRPSTVPIGAHFERARKEAMLVHPSGVEIDLHRRVEALHRGSGLSEAALFSSPQRVLVAATEVQTLPWTGVMIHACLHLAGGDTRLSTMGDLVRLCQRPDLDFVAMMELARSEGVGGYVDWALERVEDWTVLPSAVTEARRLMPVRAHHRHFARYMQSHPRAALLTEAVASPERLARVGEFIWPDPEFLEHMGRTRRMHLRHLAGRLRGFVTPRRSRLRADDQI